MLKCPHCQKKLKQLHRDAGVIRHCTLCSGSLVHWDILAAENVSRTFLDDLKKFTKDIGPPKDNIKCPTCSRPMRSINIWNGKDVLELRVCQSCEVIWLKDGERRKLPDHSDVQLTYFERPAYSPDDISDGAGFDLRASIERLPRGMELKTPLLVAPTPISGEDLLADRDFAVQPQGFFSTLGGLIGLPGEISPVIAPRRRVVSRLLALFTLIINLAGIVLPNSIEWVSGIFAYSNLPLSIFMTVGLLTFGSRVEGVIGSLKFILLLALAMGGGSAINKFLAPNADITLGATAFVLACFAFYVVAFPYAKMTLAPFWSLHLTWLNFNVIAAAMVMLVVLVAISQFAALNSALGLFSIHGLLGISLGAVFAGITKPRI